MSTATDLATWPNSPVKRRMESAIFALQISFLVGGQLTLGQEPPIHCFSTTATRWPERARCKASDVPPVPLPRIRASTCVCPDIAAPSRCLVQDGTRPYDAFAQSLKSTHNSCRQRDAPAA